MQKLKDMINNYLDGISYPEINQEYVKAIEIIKENMEKPYNKINRRFYSIFELCIMVAELDDVNEDFNVIKDLFNRCHEFFDYADLKTVLNLDFYYGYYYDLQVIYFYDKLGPNNEYDLTEEDKENAKKSYNMNNQFLMKYIFKHKEDKDPIDAIRTLYYMFPNINLFIQFLDYEKVRVLIEQSQTSEMLDKTNRVSKTESKSSNKTLLKTMREAKITIHDNYSKIINFYEKVSQEVKSRIKRINKTKNNYQKIIKDLEYHQNSYINIKEADLMFLKEGDPDILNEYLLYVMKHNTKYHEEVYAENQELTKQIPSALELLMEIKFNKYNYNLNQMGMDYLMELSKVNNLDDKLAFFTSSSFDYLRPTNPLFLTILQNLSLDNIKYIGNLLKDRIIDQKFLNYHISLITDKEQFINFKENIDVLKDYNLNNIVKYNSEILLIDNDLIVKRLNLMINKYKISLKDVYNFEFLENNQVFDLLDNFIELGYYSVIKKNPNYLKTDNLLMIKRLIIAQMIEMNVVDSNNSFVGSITTGKDFYVANQDLDSFINENILDYSIEQPRIDIKGSDLSYTVPLLDYEYDEVSYKINNKILSKNRILRNIHQDNQDLYNSILYKSINLDDETINIIAKITNHKTKKLQIK